MLYSILFNIPLCIGIRAARSLGEGDRGKSLDTYDCLLQQEILFRIISRIKVTDNAQGAELCSQYRLQTDKKCRGCKVGGNSRYMETNEGYKSLCLVSEKNIQGI